MSEKSEFVFTPVTLADRELFQSTLSGCELYKNLPSSEITFECIYCWAAGDNALRCVMDEGIIVFFANELGHSNVFYPPLVKKPEFFAPVLKRMVDYSREKGFGFYAERFTSNLAELAKQVDCGCVIKPRRNDFEYLYNTDDLARLAGGEYKSKRNLVGGFCDRYDYDFVSYDKKMRNEILRLTGEWGDVHDAADAAFERKALERALDSIDELDLFCDVLRVEGEIVAFELGFVNQANVGVVMFEKANAEYRGSWQAVNNFFVKKHFDGKVKVVNRQEDLGLAPLRDAKSSYHPIGFSEKFFMTDRKDVVD